MLCEAFEQEWHLLLSIACVANRGLPPCPRLLSRWMPLITWPSGCYVCQLCRHLLVGGELLGPEARLPEGRLGARQPQLQVVSGGLRAVQPRPQPADLRWTGFSLGLRVEDKGMSRLIWASAYRVC